MASFITGQVQACPFQNNNKPTQQLLGKFAHSRVLHKRSSAGLSFLKQQQQTNTTTTTTTTTTTQQQHNNTVATTHTHTETTTTTTTTTPATTTVETTTTINQTYKFIRC